MRLVLLAAEVGGRWSEEIAQFLFSLRISDLSLLFFSESGESGIHPPLERHLAYCRQVSCIVFAGEAFIDPRNWS